MRKLKSFIRGDGKRFTGSESVVASLLAGKWRCAANTVCVCFFFNMFVCTYPYAYDVSVCVCDTRIMLISAAWNLQREIFIWTWL